jgi:hypothetical protein
LVHPQREPERHLLGTNASCERCSALSSLAALRLTPEEIEALLRGARETSEWAKTIYPGLRIAQQIYSPERYQRRGDKKD